MAFLAAGPFVGPGTGNDLLMTFFFSPLVLLCCLMGAFAGLGRRIWRWPVVVVWTPLMGLYAAMITGGSSLREFEVFVLGIVGVVSLTTLALRIWKGDLMRIKPDTDQADALQFGIKHLLIWTTVAAILVAICQAIWNATLSGGGTDLIFIFGLAASLAIATVIDIWAFFGMRITTDKLVVVVLMTAASAIANYYLMRHNSDFFVIVAIVNQVLVILLMWILRMQGYRFVKRK